MAEVINGRMSVRRDSDIVVFLIGMRINKWWKVHKWLPAFFAMPRMLNELRERPELGFLHAESYFGRTMMLIQYWQSVEQLNAYASSKDHAHLPAWRAFNRSIGGNGDVGIFHETYRVKAGDWECIYANMPRFGLGVVEAPVPATGSLVSAHDRMTKAHL